MLTLLLAGRLSVRGPPVDESPSRSLPILVTSQVFAAVGVRKAHRCNRPLKRVECVLRYLGADPARDDTATLNRPPGNVYQLHFVTDHPAEDVLGVAVRKDDWMLPHQPLHKPVDDALLPGHLV